MDDENFHWGRGDFGVFGNGSLKTRGEPEKNAYFETLAKTDKIKILKLKSCQDYSMALFSTLSPCRTDLFR